MFSIRIQITAEITRNIFSKKAEEINTKMIKKESRKKFVFLLLKHFSIEPKNNQFLVKTNSHIKECRRLNHFDKFLNVLKKLKFNVLQKNNHIYL